MSLYTEYRGDNGNDGKKFCTCVWNRNGIAQVVNGYFPFCKSV